MTLVTDPLNNKRDYDYDARGFMNSDVVKRNSDQAVIYQTTYEYDLVGNLKKVTDGEGRITTMNYDDLNRMINSTDPANATSTFAYDENGNNTIVIDALSRQWTSSYDKKNRLESETDPLVGVSRWQYDAADQLLSVISQSRRVTRYTYDERGQRKTVTDGLGNVVTFNYDNRGNLKAMTDQRGAATTFEHDELFRLIGQRDPLGRLTTFEYDEVSNVKAKVDRLGRRIDIVYDALNRPQQVTYADATVAYGYDDAYRWTSISDAAGTITWGYDEASRVKTETTGLGVIQYDYNKANQRKTMIAADRAPVTYGYDTAGRLQTIIQGSETFTYGYDTLSRQTSLSRPNGVTTNYQYDQENRLNRLTHVNASGVTLEDLQYEFNLDDEINKITSLASAPLVPASKTVSVADAANRIGQLGAASFGFDAEGQTTSKTDASGTNMYQWDARGRLTQVTLPNGQTVSYGYDSLGRRTSRTTAGNTTTFQYDGEDVVIDRVVGGSATDYLNGPGIDEKLRQTNGGSGALYFLTDHLGSTIAMTSSLGAIIERSQYEAFGVNSSGAQTRYGFTNRELDVSTGLIYYRARWYDPQQGRFLSEDPIGHEGGLNLYSYVDNDPISFTDPLGLQSMPRPAKTPTPTPTPTGREGNCCDGTGGSLPPGIGLAGRPPLIPVRPVGVGGAGARVGAGAAGAAVGGGFVATGGTIIIVIGVGALAYWWTHRGPKPAPAPPNPYPPIPSSCPEPENADWTLAINRPFSGSSVCSLNNFSNSQFGNSINRCNLAAWLKVTWNYNKSLGLTN
jgi:RHS repeat-associated protein